jgi:catechol 2,3-dioxygenase-like lactoylglutathione lyase family enzyme
MTTPNYKAKVFSPILPVADMNRAIRFYTEVLGFEVIRQFDDENSILRRGDVSLQLTRVDEAVLNSTCGHMEIYVEVEDIDVLWSHVSQFKDVIRFGTCTTATTPIRHRAPYNESNLNGSEVACPSSTRSNRYSEFTQDVRMISNEAINKRLIQEKA